MENDRKVVGHFKNSVCWSSLIYFVLESHLQRRLMRSQLYSSLVMNMIYSRNNLQIENWMKRYEVFLLHVSYSVTFETTKALRMPQYDCIRGKEIFFRRVLVSIFWFTNFTLNKQCRIISGKASLVGIFLYSEEVTFLFSLLYVWKVYLSESCDVWN